MASRVECLVSQVDEEEDQHEVDSGDMPMRRRARGEEVTIRCLGTTALGERCARNRQAIFCSEHEEYWTYLTDELKSALRALAEGKDALNPSVWNQQYSVVREFFSTLDNTDRLKIIANLAEAGEQAVLEARAEFNAAKVDCGSRLAGAPPRGTHC